MTMQRQLEDKSHEAEGLLFDLEKEQAKTRELKKSIKDLTFEMQALKSTIEADSVKIERLEKDLQEKIRALKELGTTSELSSQESLREQQKLEKEIATLKNELSQKQSVISRQISELEQLTAKLNLLQSENADLLLTNTQLQQANEQLGFQLNDLLSKARETKNQLEIQISGLEDIIKKLTLDVKHVSEKLEQEQLTTRSLREELKDINQKLSEAKREGSDKAGFIDELESQRDELTLQLKDSQEAVLLLQQEIISLKSLNESLLSQKDSQHSQALMEMQSQLEDKSREADGLLFDLEKEQAKTKELTQALSTAKEEIVELKLTIDDLSSQLETAARKLHSAEDTTRELRSELLDLHSELEINQGRQQEISMELRRSKGQNRSLISELEALKAHHNNLKERQEDLLFTLESRERENGILREHIHGLREQNYRLITGHKQLLDEHAELRGELNVQRFTVLRLTEESKKLRGIVNDQELKIFGLNALIAQRDDQIQELETRCRALQQRFKEQLAQSISIHDFEMLKDELAANQRILALSNDHVTDLEAENARLRALLARGGSLPQETGMSRNRGEKWRHIASEESESEELDVSNVWDPSFQNRKTKPALPPRSKTRRAAEHEEDITVTKIPSLDLEESADTTSADEDSDYSMGRRRKPMPSTTRILDHNVVDDGGSEEDSSHADDSRRGGRRYPDYDEDDESYDHDSRDSHDSRRGRRRDHDYDEDDESYDHDSRDSHDSRRGRRRDHDPHRGHGIYGHRPRGRDHDEEYSETDEHRRRGPLPPTATRTGTHSPSSILRGDLPAMSSSATRASATVALPRTIEDVHGDINQAIGDSNPHYTTGIIGARPAAAATPDTRYVRLASVNPAAPTHPARKLLDADLDKVTVYRRFTESAISPTEKAKVILSSMGIPPDKSKGFELPTELVINNSADPNDPIFNEDGRNNNSVAIIKEMFRIYNDYKQEEDLEARSGPTTPRSSTI